MRPIRAKNWHHWFYLHSGDVPRLLKGEVALRLGISAAEFSKRFSPERYNPAVSDDEVRLTAEMLGQSAEYVRKIFPRKVAA